MIITASSELCSKRYNDFKLCMHYIRRSPKFEQVSFRTNKFSLNTRYRSQGDTSKATSLQGTYSIVRLGTIEAHCLLLPPSCSRRHS
jgi:hypothetical protein